MEFWSKLLNIFDFFSESDIELEEKSIEEKNMTENLENEATKRKEENTNLPVEQILSNEMPIQVGCDETSSVRKR